MSNATPGPSSAGMKRKSAAGKACLNCRRRKSRCNGLPPVCQTCEAYNDDCVWGSDDDARKPASRQYVNALQQRIKVLEAALQSNRQYVPSAEGLEEEEKKEEAHESLATTMLHLHMSEAGEDVHYHGPTSAYAHASHVPALSTSPAMAKVLHTADRPHDYRLFLPRNVDITHAQHSMVLDRFFRFFASWGMRASPDLFMQDMVRTVMLPPNTPPARFSHYSPFLHNIILAIALMWAEDDQLCHADTRAIFADHAESFLPTELARPTLATVQGLALKSSLHSTLGDHTSGWAYFGMAERVCLSLGLNINCSDLVTAGKMSASEMHYRQNTFWTVFMQEQCWAVYIGRPHVVQDYSIPLPTPDTALDELPWTWHSLDVPDQHLPPQPSMYSTTFVETAKLMVISQKVMSTFYSPKSDTRLHNEQRVSELSIALDSWSEALPSSLVITGHSNRNALPHIIVLQLAKEWLTLLIYRPYYRSISTKAETINSVLDTAVTRCDRSADRINALLRIYHGRFGLRYTPPTVFNIVFMAGTTHLLAAVWHRAPSMKANALRNASECVTFLRHVAESWPAAGQKADILHALVNDYAEPTATRPKAVPKTREARLPVSPKVCSPTIPTPVQPGAPNTLPGGLDWFASMIQNPEAVSGWETQISRRGMPEGMSTGQAMSPTDTSSDYLRALISMLNPSPSAVPTMDQHGNWAPGTAIPSNTAGTWADTTLQFDNSPQQSFDLPWNFDLS